MLKKLAQLTILMTASLVAASAQSNVTAAAQRISGDTFNVSTTTPKGARVYGVTMPSAAMLGAIDNGLTDLFAVARKYRYSRRLNYSDYAIYIARPDRTQDKAGAYSPGIAIGAAQYRGSVYDQGGFIYVAGMVISNDPCAFLIVDSPRDPSLASNYVRYEGEHLVLYHNDRQRYLATMDHSKGGGHPILQ